MTTYHLHLVGGATIQVDASPHAPVLTVVERGLALRDRLLVGEPVATRLTDATGAILWTVDLPQSWSRLRPPRARDAATTPSPTRHTCRGGRAGRGLAFGRTTPGCPRCDELIAGAPARRWSR